MKKTLVAAVISAISCLLFSAIIVRAEPDRRECAICGMWIDQYERTSHVIVLNHGERKNFCSFACAAKYVKANRRQVETIRAADFITKQLVEAEKAFYLQGSDVPGVMSYVSTIAFAARNDAEKFQRTHGGRIITFSRALAE